MSEIPHLPFFCCDCQKILFRLYNDSISCPVQQMSNKFVQQMSNKSKKHLQNYVVKFVYFDIREQENMPDVSRTPVTNSQTTICVASHCLSLLPERESLLPCEP